MKIYTKTGDKGTTRLVDGSCVEKFDPRVEAYGSADELNSYLGLIFSLLENNEQLNFSNTSLRRLLFDMQNNLFVVGSLLATVDPVVFNKLPQLDPEETTHLEKGIDAMTSELEPLKNFILPTGHVLSSHFHIARTLCRRCERRTVEVANHEPHYEQVIMYLNRLSDFLFTAARFVNHRYNTQDVPWKKK
ncbi:ATP:cob(I)alamin adenosyltransferase [Bdellovibrio sp. qaytius]|nr:ATP:cob(I)alamin adenosyltransferase [Bdellovibrio sp. qaytius]